MGFPRKAADAVRAAKPFGQSLGPLLGLPITIKEAFDLPGTPTTWGFEHLRHNIAQQPATAVARLQAAGAIVLGKTNVPVALADWQTFNPVYGTTHNPWDLTHTPGGSAAALAAGLSALELGSDIGASIRNPVHYCGVYGHKPTWGMVPMAGHAPPGGACIDSLDIAVAGPMARSVRDLARLLATQSGHDPHQPLSINGSLDVSGLQYTPEALHGLRVGWLDDLGGHMAMEDGILGVCEDTLRAMQNAGARVEPTALGYDTQALWACWLVWRRALVGPKVATLLPLPGAPEQLKPEAMWEYENSLKLSHMDFQRASQRRTGFYHHLLKLFEHHDVLALPVAQVWPFALEARWPQQIGGRAMDTYHRWMECTIYAALAGLPAISMPAGFHADKPWPWASSSLASRRAMWPCCKWPPPMKRCAANG